MRLDKLVYLHWILPAVNLAIETEKQDNKSWCSGHSSGAMDIDLLASPLLYSLGHSIEPMAGVKEALTELT